MIVYRLTNGDFIDDLSGSGAKLYGGRWNSAGIPAIYTTEHISLAILEVLVHLRKDIHPPNYHLVQIEIPSDENCTIIDRKKLKKTWKDDIAYGRFIGDEFLNSNQSLVLKVPSAIVEQENNYILNPLHSDSAKIKILSSAIFIFDKRLYLDNE